LEVRKNLKEIYLTFNYLWVEHWAKIYDGFSVGQYAVPKGKG